MRDDSRPTATPSSPSGTDPVASFDAGDRGCGDGLAQEFRRHIDAVAVGDRLRVVVRDPSAKADIPPVARMLGHRVLSEEALDDGRLVITVERGHVRKADL
jgi:TusA-related sulfurtransferase